MENLTVKQVNVTTDKECIIVTPIDENGMPLPFFKVESIHFWYSGSFNHEVNEHNVQLFLRHAQLFGPTVFPNDPTRGCSAIGSSSDYENGAVPVNQISYKGQVIYCRC